MKVLPFPGVQLPVSLADRSSRAKANRKSHRMKSDPEWARLLRHLERIRREKPAALAIMQRWARLMCASTDGRLA